MQRAKNLLDPRLPTQDEIGGALCLGGCVDNKLSIVVQLREPAGDVGGVILDYSG